jgi:hypothetical protein
MVCDDCSDVAVCNVFFSIFSGAPAVALICWRCLWHHWHLPPLCPPASIGCNIVVFPCSLLLLIVGGASRGEKDWCHGELFFCAGYGGWEL